MGGKKGEKQSHSGGGAGLRRVRAHHQNMAAAAREDWVNVFNGQTCQVAMVKRAERNRRVADGADGVAGGLPAEWYLSQPLWSGAERGGPSLTRPSHGLHSRCR